MDNEVKKKIKNLILENSNEISEIEKNKVIDEILIKLDELDDKFVTLNLCELYDKTFEISSYQRGYRWRREEVRKLLTDLSKFYKENKETQTKYCLQPIIIKIKNNGNWELIDGQQRLITLLLILKAKGQKKRYNLLFDTRDNDEENESIQKFLNVEKKDEDGKIVVEDNIENIKTIDGFYINEAKKEINEFIKNDQEWNNVKEIINNEKIVFLCYEVDKNESPNGVFSRINDGKIPLTDAELSKAMLLKLEENEKENEEKLKFEQRKKAQKWDKIENTFQNDEFWYFLINKEKEKKYEATRIDFLFDIYHKNPFDHIEKQIADGIKTGDIWEELVKKFNILYDWYTDNELYHLVGYYICINQNECIKIVEKLKKIYDECKNRETFKGKIKEMIIENLKGTYKEYIEKNNEKSNEKSNDNTEKNIYLNKISYVIEEKEERKKKIITKKIIRDILLLFNCVSMIDEKRRLSFAKFKNEKYDIEHIYPSNDGIDDENKRKIMEESVIDYLENVKRKKENEKEESRAKEIDKLINKLKKAEEIEEFKIILKEINKELNMVEPNDKNSIGNLTLLNEALNKSVSNYFLEQKRKKIIQAIIKEKEDKKKENEHYILPCTERVYFKFYTKDILQTDRWDETDVQEYLSAIENKINKVLKCKLFINEKNKKEGIIK